MQRTRIEKRADNLWAVKVLTGKLGWETWAVLKFHNHAKIIQDRIELVLRKGRKQHRNRRTANLGVPQDAAEGLSEALESTQ